MQSTELLRLIYVLKIGYNSKGEGLYEFIFSKDPSAVDTKAWGWENMPANSNAQPPADNCIDLILSLKTDKVDLICLHELNDRMYIDGYYTIHALAFQNLDDDSTDIMYEELPIMVFHYGMKVKEVEDILYTRDLRFKSITPEKSETVLMSQPSEENDDDDDGDIEELIV
jgi:hypothetical protein